LTLVQSWIPMTIRQQLHSTGGSSHEKINSMQVGLRAGSCLEPVNQLRLFF
jgi:hypothetical protein